LISSRVTYSTEILSGPTPALENLSNSINCNF
jgi:hypothetical protein